MPFSQADAYVGDYLGSEHLLFLAPAVKEHAEGVLRAFFGAAEKRGTDSLETLRAKAVEAILFEDLARLQLPVPAKRAFPDLLEGFFGYLKDTGRFPGAGSWKICVETVAEKFRSSIRDDGTARGETFRKQYSKVGRNDPCPCGSGKKFKQCCGPLIGM